MKKLLVLIVLVSVTFIIFISESYAQIMYACVNSHNGAMRYVAGPGMCKKGETQISWNIQGPKGDTGATGKQGPPGVANGITRVVHGTVGWNGNIISGNGFSIGNPNYIPGNVDSYPYSVRTAILFDEPFTSLPTCTASAYPSSTGDYVTAVIIGVDSYDIGVVIRYQQPVPDYPYSWYTRSGITFICVQ